MEISSERPPRPRRGGRSTLPEEKLNNIIREIRRRTIWQCLAIYLTASWLALQIVDVLKDNMGLPDWVFPFAVVLLVIGLPVVLATAIVQERLPGQTAPPPLPRSDTPEPGDYATPRQRDRRPEAGSIGPVSSPVAGTPERAPAIDKPHHRLFTWRNALAGGALAFVLLLVVTTGFMYMRSNGIGPAGTLVAKGVIDERSPVLVAEFGSSDTDAELARAMTEAFRIDFSQTQIVRLVEPARIAEALRRMELDAAEPLTMDVARRLARREGIAAVIGGSFARVPGGFVMTGRIEDPDGTVLASHRETAADSSAVLPAIDALSEKLRERLGESFSSLRADAPLARVTTSSLRALELYSDAVHTIDYEGDDEAGVLLLEEALEVDPEFASAWRKLGVVIGNMDGSEARIQQAITRAFELRDRLTHRERYLTEASYYTNVRSDRRRAIEAYERMLDVDPDDSWAANNVAVLYGDEGEHERALELTKRAVALDTSSVSLGNLVGSYLQVRDVEMADSSLRLYRRHFPTDRRVGFMATSLEVHREDYEAAEAAAREAVDKTDGAAFAGNLVALSFVLRTTGRLAEAEEAARRASRAFAEAGFPASEYGLMFWRFWTEVTVREDQAEARRVIERTLETAPLDSLDPLDRPYLGLAVAYARLGDRVRAERMMSAFHEALPDAPPARYEDDRAMMDGALALAEGRWHEAIAAFEEARRLEPRCTGCLEYAIGLAHEGAGRPDSALVHLEREIDMPGPARLGVRSATLGPALERMARILDATGRLDEAAAYYARFAVLWAEADPEFQPRVAAARARAEEIVRSRG